MLQVFLDFNPLRGPSTPSPHGSISVVEPFSPPCAHLALMLAILPVLLAILAPTCPTSALKMPEKCHLGANIAKQMLQPPLLAPQNTKKQCFLHVFVGFLLYSPCAKIVPKCSQHAPKTSQVEPKIANLALSWPILVATCCQLGPNFAHLAPIFAPTCAEIPRKPRAASQKVPLDLPGLSKTRFSGHRPPPGTPKY